jgi:hypothetical protein
MKNPEDAEFARVGGTLPDGHEKYTYYGGSEGPTNV